MVCCSSERMLVCCAGEDPATSRGCQQPMGQMWRGFLHGQWGLVGLESAARATSAVGEAAPSRRRGSCVIRKLQTNPRKESENQVSDVGS